MEILREKRLMTSQQFSQIKLKVKNYAANEIK